MVNEFPMVELGEVASVRSGFAFKSEDMGEYGAPIIKIKNIIPPTVDIQDIQRAPRRIVENDSRIQHFTLQKGDILIAMTGATVGKVGRMPKTNETYYLNQRVGKVFLTAPDKADYNFIYYALSRGTHVRQMFGIADGSAQANISGSQIESLEIPLPCLDEQRAIAAILGALDDKIELNRQMNQTLEAMAQALFKSWFVDFEPLRDKGMEDSPLGPIPRRWRAGTLGEICDIVMGQSPPGETYNELGNGTPFYQGIRDFGFRFPTRRVFCTAPTRSAQKGDVLLSVRAPVGNLNMAIERCAVGRGVAALRLKSHVGSFPYYLLKCDPSSWEKFEAEGTVFGAVTKADVHGFETILPPLNIVCQFNQIVEPLDAKIELNDREFHTLATIRDTLMPKLLSGEIRVKDAERFVEKAI